MGAFSACQLTIMGEAFMVSGDLKLQELPSMQDFGGSNADSFERQFDICQLADFGLVGDCYSKTIHCIRGCGCEED
jgi:hypothetical protein